MNVKRKNVVHMNFKIEAKSILSNNKVCLTNIQMRKAKNVMLMFVALFIVVAKKMQS